MTLYHLIVVGSLIVAAFAQMALKKGASMPHSSFVFEYLNPWVLGGYALMFLSMMIDVWCVGHGVMVKELSTMESLSYLFVPLLGWAFFGEKLSARKFLWIAVIIIGVIVFFI